MNKETHNEFYNFIKELKKDRPELFENITDKMIERKQLDVFIGQQWGLTHVSNETLKSILTEKFKELSNQ